MGYYSATLACLHTVCHDEPTTACQKGTANATQRTCGGLLGGNGGLSAHICWAVACFWVYCHRPHPSRGLLRPNSRIDKPNPAKLKRNKPDNRALAVPPRPPLHDVWTPQLHEDVVAQPKQPQPAAQVPLHRCSRTGAAAHVPTKC